MLVPYVWLASINHGAYQGESVLGVYPTEDDARRACERDDFDRRHPRPFLGPPKPPAPLLWRRTWFEDDDPEEQDLSHSYADVDSGTYCVRKYPVE